MTLCVRRGSWSESAHNRIKEAGRETNRIQGEDKERLKEWEKKELRLRKERRRELVGGGGYQGQEQLRSATPAVPSEARQRGSRWAISGRILRCRSCSRAGGAALRETSLLDVGEADAGMEHIRSGSYRTNERQRLPAT